MHTPRTRRFLRLAPILASLVVAGALVAPAFAAPTPTVVLTFPGCAPTLQGCITAAPEGARIELATDGPIQETLSIQRSLQLVAADGFEPVFTPFARILAIGAAGMPRHLVLSGLTWEPAGSSGAIQVTHGSDGTFDVEITRNRFLGITGSSGGSTVSVLTTGVSLPAQLGALNLLLADNDFEAAPGTGADTNPVNLTLARECKTNVHIENNRIHTSDLRQQGTIEVYHAEGTLQLEVARNVVVSGNPGMPGLNVWQLGNGTGHTSARVVNNVMTGIDGGMRFGASFYASEGRIDLTVVHNTISRANLRAVQVGGRPDLGGHAEGIIANNVLVWSERSDVGIHEFGDTVHERRNLVTHIGGDDDAPPAPSPDTIVVDDPRFVGPDDYRLQPSSAGINTGSNEFLPEGLDSDFDRNPRLAGANPDMGAFELPCDEHDTEPHCVKQPSCEETGCETSDPCAPAQCMNDRCIEVPLRGLASAQCVCDRVVPTSCPTTSLLSGIARRVSRACTHLDRAGDPARARRKSRLLLNAGRAFDRALWQVGRRAFAGQIPPTCAKDLESAYQDAIARIGNLLL